MKMTFDRVAVDGDILLYSVGFATQTNIYHVYKVGQWSGDPIWVMSDKRKLNALLKDEPDDYIVEKWVDVQPAMSGCLTLDRILEGYQKRFGTKNIEVYLTGDENFRIPISVTLPYKGNRLPDKPYNYQMLKNFLIWKWKATVVKYEEADDMLSKIMYASPRNVAVTEDKDLLNTPGYLYRREELILIDEASATRNFYRQLLTGDKSTDNIQGVPGLGEVKADKILAGAESWQELECRVGMQYALAYDDPEAVMTEMGQLLWMRRQDGELWRIGGQFETEKRKEQGSEVPELGSRRLIKHV